MQARLPFRVRIALIASLKAIQYLYAHLAHPHFRHSCICIIFTTLTIRERNHPIVRLIQRSCRRQITLFLIPAGGRFGRFSWEYTHQRHDEAASKYTTSGPWKSSIDHAFD